MSREDAYLFYFEEKFRSTSRDLFYFEEKIRSTSREDADLHLDMFSSPIYDFSSLFWIIQAI